MYSKGLYLYDPQLASCYFTSNTYCLSIMSASQIRKKKFFKFLLNDECIKSKMARKKLTKVTNYKH